MRVFIGFAGCKVNQAERTVLYEGIIGEGMERADDVQSADVIVYNTCCVTKKAEYGCRQVIRKFNRDNPGAKIIVTGCYAERAKTELEQLPGVAAVLGNAGKEGLPGLVRKAAAGMTIRERAVPPLSFELSGMVRDRARALLKVQDGCDAFCSYCIVPYVRGKPVSMPADLVMKNLRNLKNEKEVVLTGIHLGKWGMDLGGSIEQLMQKIREEQFPFRIRLSSLEPLELTDVLLDTLASMKNFCPHFHIPLQNGSDRILGMMKRNYSTAEFSERLQSVRSRFPFAGVGIDIIAGFPGETDQDFDETRRLLEASAIDYMHIFSYSPREGTAAFSMKPVVNKEIVRRRMDVLRSMDTEKREQFTARFSGRAVLGLFDRKEKGSYRAVTREYLKIYLAGDPGREEFQAVVTNGQTGEAVMQ